MLTPLSPEEADDWGERLNDLIDEIADASRGTLSSEDIWSRIASGQWWLIGINDLDGVAILEPIKFSTGLHVLEVVGLAGDDMKKWESASEELERVARHMGFHRLRAGGRMGWARIAERHGWKRTRVIVEKDLFDA